MNEVKRAKRMIAWPLAIGGCAVVMLFWVSSCWDLWRTHNLTLADNDRELASLASAIAEQTARSMQAVELILRRTANDENVRRVKAAPDDAREFLRRQIDGAPQVHELSIADATGRLVANSARADTTHINASGRSYFQQLEHAKGDAVAISEPITSLFDGERTFVMAMRLHDADDRFAGVVLALVEESYFKNFYKQVDVSPGTGIQLLRNNGEPIISYGPPRRIASDRVVRAVVHAVQGYPLAIEVSRENRAVLSQWYGTVINVMTRTGLISVFIALLAFVLFKQLRRVEQTTERLRASELRWRTVFEHAPVGVVVLRAGRHYLTANPAFEQMVGYSEKELLELRAPDITYPDDVAVTEARIGELARGERDSVRFQKRYVHRDGRVVWADMSVARVFAPQEEGQECGRELEDMIIATVEDVTQRLEDERERRRLEEQLRQSQKLEALGTFAGGVAHDFNNILGAILGFGERALPLLGEGTPERRYIEHVMRAGERARSLVERILTFSRSGMAAREAVDVRSVVVEAIELLKATLPGAITLSVRLEVEDAFVLGDATHVHQVVMNLCSNAVHAMPEGGVLSIALVRAHFAAPRSFSHGAVCKGDFVCLSVADSGVGIRANVLERMFNPFFTTRRAGEGTGLGLSLVDGIVREYGGGIDVETALGKGTRFDVYLPLADALPAAKAHGDEALPRGEGQVVLLVDDEETLVTLSEEVLAELGYEPVGFCSSVEAWQALQEDPQRFDVVVTDQTMPELTGLALATRILTLRRDLPVILCSGFSTVALEEEARAAGVVTVLRKPLRQADLAAALDRVFRQVSPH